MSSINFYRSDGWVKTTQGPAVPGAQVYILTQPANVVAPITPPRTTPVPFVPNPQAQIYSDSGNTPIVQPIITDGFGHYNFYVLPGLYTVAIYYGGKLQNYYVDQSIGNIGSSSGSSVVFETNGSPNFNQLLQNLVQGAGIVISTDNLGNTTIRTSGGVGAVDFEINGSPLSSQATVNFEDSPTVTFADAGAGGIKATVVTPAVPTSGQNLIPGLQWNQYLNPGEAGALSSPLPIVGYTYAEYVPGTVIAGTASSSKMSIFVSTAFSAPIQEFVIIRTLKNSLTTVDITVVTFGGSPTPAFALGYNTSDPIPLVIDSAHDYFVCVTGNVFGGSGSLWINEPANNYVTAGNTNIGGASYPNNLCSHVWASSIGAGGGWSGAFPIGIGSPPVNFISSWVVT